MNPPRDHHFVPAFYLAQWCKDPTDDASKLIEYSFPYGSKLIDKSRGRRATGFERDLYTFRELPSDQAQFLEQRFFSYVDDIAAKALRMLLAGDSNWTSETRSGWSRFMVSLHLRHPDAIPELRAAARSLWSGNGEEYQRLYEEIRQPGDPLSFDEHIAEIDPLVPVKVEVNAIIKMIDHEQVGGHINNMCWDVIDVSAAPYRLLTSDRPVVLSQLKTPSGLINPSGSITVPISPTKFFVAANDRRGLEHVRAMRSRDIVAWANQKTVERARRYVWARDTAQERFINKHMGKTPEPQPLLPGLGRYVCAQTQQAIMAKKA